MFKLISAATSALTDALILLIEGSAGVLQELCWKGQPLMHESNFVGGKKQRFHRRTVDTKLKNDALKF